MKILFRQFLAVSLLLCAAGALNAALALPANVTVTPHEGARFLRGQKFDLRVEGQGTGPFSATLFIDGRQVEFTSGVQNSMTTDGITVSGWGGFNVRGYFQNRPGPHTIRATFGDASGVVTVTARFEIIDPARNTNFVRALMRENTDAPASAALQTEAAPEADATGRSRGRGVTTTTFDRASERAADAAAAEKSPIKNIILLIGDGMGSAHRTAARIVQHGVTNGRPNGYLAMDRFPGAGFLSTHSLNSIITDSAPGMACYTTGNHFNNNQEGVFPARVINPFFAPRVEYLSEYLHRTAGKSLGIVSTADIEDATPASNAVHTLNRGAGTGICDQYLDEADTQNTGRFGTGLRGLLGGGR
ncbi:MAG: alkaline phosphatase, partial [Blastocatellia bacterium]